MLSKQRKINFLFKIDNLERLYCSAEDWCKIWCMDKSVRISVLQIRLIVNVTGSTLVCMRVFFLRHGRLVAVCC